MDHETARTTYAAERYALDEMTPEERDRFEEHYFDCGECAASVRETAVFVASGRAVVREKQTFDLAAWRRHLPAAAAIFFAAIVGWQNLVMPRAAAPAPVMELPQRINLPMTDARSGEETKIQANRRTELAIPIGTGFDSYVCVLIGPDGVEHPIDVHRRELEEETLFLSIRELPAGRYKLSIEGVRKDGKRAHIDSYVLQVR